MNACFTLFAFRNLIGEVPVLEDMTSHFPVIEIRIEECRGNVFNGRPVRFLRSQAKLYFTVVHYVDLVFTFCLCRWGDRCQDQRFEDQVIMWKRPWTQRWYFPVNQLGALPPPAGPLPWIPVRQGKDHPEVSDSSWFQSWLKVYLTWQYVSESSAAQPSALFQCSFLLVQLIIFFPVKSQ